jgi:simple sugar transport system ATP-binding protein
MIKSSEENHDKMISMRGITKSFPGVLANDQISFDVYKSEVHALLGENGAGKSTLMKILYGFYSSDEGEILMEGNPITINSPQDAREYRIGMVFQDFTQIPAFTVLENIALFLPNLPSIYNQKLVEERITEVSKRYGLEVDPYALVSQLSIGEQQKVEIIKLLLSDSKILILDEPTRVLAPHEVDALFEILESLRDDGYAIIFITHKLREVLAFSDRITVLRGGKVAGTLLRSDASEEKLVGLIFSRRVAKLQEKKAQKRERPDTPLLKLRSIETRGEGVETSLQDINLEIYSGEIVGVAGVSGNGQKALGDVILGMEKSLAGEKWLFGKNLTNRPIGEIRREGLGFIPENPLSMAAAPWLTVLENMALTNTWRYQLKGGLNMDWTAVRKDYQVTQEELGFTFSFYTMPKALSGGNLQRMVIVREMTHDPQLLIASYLTRGLDVQSTQAAREALLQARDNGAGVLLISEDLEELFALSDRLVVLYNGRIVGSFDPSATTVYEVGHLMTGAEVNNGATAYS